MDSSSPDADPRDIAVIGMSGRFPGADDVDEFWRNISTGRECFTTFTDDELRSAGVAQSDLDQPGYVRRRPVLRDIRSFDAEFFGASPREATLADPQQLLFTECAWEALESAGYAATEQRGPVGVFAGTNISTYLLTRPNAFRMGVDVNGLMIGNDKDALATSVSFRFDLRGPSVSVQTFCSTSLVAVHLACASLRNDDCEMALAGGVSVKVPDRVGYLYEAGNQASPDGRVRTFDAGAKGSIYGDGVAVVALKRLDRALDARDNVLAVIRASAVNNDGALKFSFQAPSIDGQRRCISSALHRAGVDPAQISYVEAHGTATEVGDPMEVAALTAAFGETGHRQYCILGSVKPNIGHLDRASGVTGLIKVVQSLRHELIPGTLHFTTPNPEIDFGGSPFRVTPEPTPWPRQPDRPRIAGLSSLGTGGTNAHAIILEAPLPAARPPRTRRWQVLPISARSASAVSAAAGRLADRLSCVDDLDIADVAHTLQSGRRMMYHRSYVVADGTESAVHALSGRRAVREDATVGRPVGLLLAGVGEQYPIMWADHLRDEPVFRSAVMECLAILGIAEPGELSPMFAAGAPPETDPLARMLGRGEQPAGPTDPTSANPALVQPAVFIGGYALARLLESWGVSPDVMIGYSLGEYVAACLAGVLSLPDALRLVAYRAVLIAEMPPGSMLAVAAPEDRVAAVIDSCGAELDVAVRAAGQLVLSGPTAPIRRAAELLIAAGIGCRELATDHAYHSRMLEPVSGRLTRWISENVTLRTPLVPYLSNVTGGPATAELVTDPGYWARHMCGTVEFGQALGAALERGGDLALVEIGPGQSLGALVRSHPACSQAQWPLVIPTVPGAMDRTEPGRVLAEAVGRLWMAGVPVNFPALHEDTAGWRPGRVDLPTYPFERQEYWLEPSQEPTGLPGDTAPPGSPAALLALPLLPESRWLNLPVWQQHLPEPPAATAPLRWLVLTDDTALAGEVVRQLMGAGHTVTPLGSRSADDADDASDAVGLHTQLVQLLRSTAADSGAPQRIVHIRSIADRPGAGRTGMAELVDIARAAGDVGLTDWSLDVVTTGTQTTAPGDRARPLNGLLTGPIRLIPVEHPGVTARLIDIAPDTDAAAVCTELLAPMRHPVVAARRGRRWTPTTEVLDTRLLERGSPVWKIRQGGVYLLTGGLGGIGLALAERLARDHGARLVLLSRTGVPPRSEFSHVLAADDTAPEVRRRLTGLVRLEAAGGEVVTVAGDVASETDVARAVAAAYESFGALHGVLHCAGVPARGLMQFKAAADMARVLAPKVDGALALVTALRGHEIDFLALFSSTTAATGGGAGQVDYCAASAFLDTLACSDPLPGRHVLSIGWGEWTWNGWTEGLADYDEGTREYFENYRATFGISFDAGWRALQAALATGEPVVTVSTQDFPTLVEASRRSSISSQRDTVRKARAALGRHRRPDLSTPFVAPGTDRETAIARIWSEALGIEDVGIHDNFFDLGGNSLVGIEIIGLIRTELAVPELPPHSLYQAPTVAMLAKAAATETWPPGGEAVVVTDAVTAQERRHRFEQRRQALGGRRP